MEVGLWIVAAARFDFDDGSAPAGHVARVGGEPGDLLLGGLLRILALAGGRDGDRLRRRDRIRDVGRTRPPSRLPRAHALPHGRGRRDVRVAGPAPLLRLVRGDAHPALRARRRVGRGATAGGDVHLRRLHDGGIAADARGGRRVRRDPGHVLAHRVGYERQRLDLPGLRGRVRGQGAALPAARLASARVPRGARRGRGRPVRRRLEDGDLRVPTNRAAEVPGAGRRSLGPDPRARRSRARVRLAARLPCARPERRRRATRRWRRWA